MIECPFCGESYSEDDLVFEFNWGEVVTHFYNMRKLRTELKSEYRDRPFYVTLKYDRRGNATLLNISTVVNPSKHPSGDPMMRDENGWSEVKRLLSSRKMFEASCNDNDRTLPVSAKIIPMTKHHRNSSYSGEGMSSGIFCPFCEQHLKPEVLRAQSEVRILLSGRPGSGKTVYVTQLISELMQGRLAQKFTIEAANDSVQRHYHNNKDQLKAMGTKFVLATNPGIVQEPYIFLMRNNKTSIRLVIQDIAGEDVEYRTKYSKSVRKADLILFFIDPWHIEEVRARHRQLNDASNDVVERSTGGKYTDLNGVFEQMMSCVDSEFVVKREQLAGVLLVKGDYLDPPMLSQGDQPECQMMSRPISFNDPGLMELSMGMRSSFIRQCLNEWDSTRVFARNVESIYPAHNTRYFVCSALGQSTHLRQGGAVQETRAALDDNPDEQFSMEDSTPAASSSGSWNYGEQVLEAPAHAVNVIDPVFWCLNRKKIPF